MKLNDKVAWLEKHGKIVKYDHFPGFIMGSALWKTSSGVYCRGEGKTEDEVWESLFENMKESLFLSINE